MPDAPASRGLISRILAIQANSALFLALFSLVALGLANSPWADAYARVLAFTPTLVLGELSVALPLRAVVGEGLMSLFFFMVGLEIRRELHAGELADLRRALLPVGAAIGGMVAPALLYLAFNPGGPARVGWGIPMATDIAFAVAALTVLGRRIAPALRVLLLALAIIDDIGGVLVIAVWYSEGIVPRGLVIAAIGVFLTLGMQANGIRRPAAYAVPAVVVFAGFHVAGVHATMAGVVMGLLTPPRGENGAPSPSERLQAALHSWVAFVVMPLFALANAGVVLEWASVDVRITLGVLVALVVGKPLGVVAGCWLVVRLRLTRLPIGVRWPGVVVVGFVAGMGFTVALFIATLAFPADPLALASAKLGILGGSVLAVTLALGLGRFVLAPCVAPGAAKTEEEAERSAER
jgi:Na+:H+ antiporter, NhaA family